jgi:hypothetical protein
VTTKQPAWKTRLGPVFVEREYQLAISGRKKQKVTLRFGKPRPAPGQRGAYYCVFRLAGLGEADRTWCLLGADGLGAFHHAVHIALTLLYCSTAYADGRLTWAGSYDLALPFAVPDAVKDRARKDPGPRPSARKTRRKSH